MASAATGAVSRGLPVLGHSPPRRARDPADQRRTVVEATPHGMKLVKRLSTSIEAHYEWMETSLGKAKLTQLYGLLDELIALEQPSP